MTTDPRPEQTAPPAAAPAPAAPEGAELSESAPARPLPRSSYVLILLAGVVSALWLLHRVDQRFLWQDEAMTAVLGERMMRFGQPLAYDGRNLITMDVVGDHEEKVFPPQTVSAEKALEYFKERKDFKKDYTWTGHPWGQFLIVGLSFELLGKSTFSARLPFVLAGVLTVMILAEWMERVFRNRLITLLAIFLLLLNIFWYAHVRQCRYYALSSLFTLTTMRFYWGWLEGNRWSPLGVIVSSWLLFQMDFGAFWPVVGAIFIYSWIDRSKSPALILGVFTTIGLSILPFIFFYSMLDRLKGATVHWLHRLLGEVFQINQYITPLVILAAACALLYTRDFKDSKRIARFVEPIFVLIPLLLVWLAVVIPFPFHRYVVAITPLAAGLTAWTLVAGSQYLWRDPRKAAVLATAGAVLLVVSPILSSPVSAYLPKRIKPIHGIGFFVRPELAFLKSEVFGTNLRDPNRTTYELLKDRLKPGDEVFVNYEDLPMMFYLDAPIRGGVACFRLGERDTPPPRYFVIRRTAQFFPYQWKIIEDLVNRCRLRPIESNIPDTPWGYCPDPMLQYEELGPAKRPALVYECLGWK